MRKIHPHFGNKIFTIAVSGWLVIAPILVICVCNHGQTAMAFQAHAVPSCDDGHEHSTQNRGDNRHEHEDQPVLDSEFLPTQSTVSLPPLELIDVIDFGYSLSYKHVYLDDSVRGRGPHDASAFIASIILQV